MNQPGAPLGNKNAAKAKKWSEAIKRAIREKYGVEQDEAFAALARKLVDEAEGGDISALKEIGDRIDGKPSQAVDIGSDPDRPVIQRVINEIVRSPNRDG